MMDDILYAKIGSGALSWFDSLADLVENSVPAFPLTREDKDILIAEIKKPDVAEVVMSLSDGFIFCQKYRENDPTDYKLYISWQHDEFIEAYIFYRNGWPSEFTVMPVHP